MMNSRLMGIVMLSVLCSVAQAAEKKVEGRYGATPLQGDYYVYGGTLGEMMPPTRKDRKVSFMFTGQLAKDLFNEIGPDVKKEAACSSADGYRERRRGDLSCIHIKGNEYSCTFGINVVSGKGTYGSIC
jgi:hypothetical protein